MIEKYRFIPSPHKYEFTRLQFLIFAHCFPHPRLKAVGNRLVRFKADDYDVKYYLIKILEPQYPQDRRQALTYAAELRKLRPNDAQPYASLASIHFRIWLVNRSPTEKELAIKNYQKAISLVSPQDRLIAHVKRIMTYMKESKGVVMPPKTTKA
jgi:tetratricopeptide (TPR) repeat protein